MSIPGPYYVVVTRDFDWDGCDKNDEPRWSASVDLRGPFATDWEASEWGKRNVDMQAGGFDWYVRRAERAELTPHRPQRGRIS